MPPQYQAYPTKKDTPNRKHRKAKRKAIFLYNQNQAKIERNLRRKEREEKNA